MSRESILSNINSLSASLATVNAKLAKLRQARVAVDGVSLELNYKITGDYHLKGEKYDTLEQEEKEILRNIKRDMRTKQDAVLEELDAAIQREETTAHGYSNMLRILNAELQYADK